VALIANFANMVNARTFGLSGISGLVLTWLGINLNEKQIQPLSEVDLPVNAVLNNEILTPWTSEDVFVQGDGTPYPDECKFYNLTLKQDATYCESFTIARTLTSTILTATERAVRCGADKGIECLLSHEIGLALPAAFLADVTSATGMRAIVAPRLISKQDEDTHVRVSTPENGATMTVLMTQAIEVEFMDEKKHLSIETFEGEHAFCVQLLRASYESQCWKKLDG
jgi:hypothetical protein